MKRSYWIIGIALILALAWYFNAFKHVTNWISMEKQENVGLRCQISKSTNSEAYTLSIETEAEFQSKTKDKKSICFFSSRKDLVASYKTCMINSSNVETPQGTRLYQISNFLPESESLMYIAYLAESKEESDKKFMKQYSDIGQLLSSLTKESFGSFILTIQTEKCEIK